MPVSKGEVRRWAAQWIRSEISRLQATLNILEKAEKEPDAADIVLGNMTRETPVKRKRTMSAEARKRISDAQKKRWAKQKRGKG